MTRINLKEEVRRAIRSEWEGFAARHPRLAKVLDESLLVEEVCESLVRDAEYQAAMNDAVAAGLAVEAVGDLLRRFVQRWMREFV